MGDLHYFEQANPFGDWTPCTADTPPVDKGPGGTRKSRIRDGSIRVVHHGHHHLTLVQLREVYGPDGRFRNTGKGAKNDR